MTGSEYPADEIGVATHGQAAQLSARHVRVLVLDAEEIATGLPALARTPAVAQRCLAATDAASALDLAERFQPHVALVDTGAVEGEPDQFSRALVRASPRTRVLVLTPGAAVSPRTRADAQIDVGQTAEVALAIDKLRFFNLETGTAIE